MNEALGQFIGLIRDPDADRRASRKVYVILGRGEFRNGRSLDSLADPMGFVDACAVVVHETQPDHVDVRFAATVSWSL